MSRWQILPREPSGSGPQPPLPRRPPQQPPPNWLPVSCSALTREQVCWTGRNVLGRNIAFILVEVLRVCGEDVPLDRRGSYLDARMAHASFSLIAGTLALHPSQTPSPLGTTCQPRPQVLRSSDRALHMLVPPALRLGVFLHCSRPSGMWPALGSHLGPPGNIPLGLPVPGSSPCELLNFHLLPPPDPGFLRSRYRAILSLTLKLR